MQARTLTIACGAALVACAFVACGSEEQTSLAAVVSSIEPACASDSSTTPITIRGTLPVKPVVSLSSSKESTIETGYRGWVGDVELTDVLWVDAATLAATVPAGIAAGVYALTIESPFGETSVLEGFRVAAGFCSPVRAALAVVEAGAAPAVVRVGSTVVVSATVRNAGDAMATGVTTAVVAPPGFTLFTSPADPLDIAAGESRTFTWTYTAEAGRGTFAVRATGVDASSGEAASAPPVNTNEVVVEEGGIATFTVGGSVTGLEGSGLVLRLNGGSNLAVSSAATSFTFPTVLAGGSQYGVTVLTQPSSPTQTCTVANGSGTLLAGDVTNVAVSCTTSSFVVRGTVSGLAGNGLELQLNGTTDLPVSGNGSFAFPPLATGTPYAVAVRTQPTGPTQACSVANGTGVIGEADVEVTITCVTRSFRVGGQLSRLAGNRVNLELGYGTGSESSLSLEENGDFTFDALVPSGSPYRVTVTSQPRGPTQVCVVTNGTGIVAGADVTAVVVTCSSDDDDD